VVITKDIIVKSVNGNQYSVISGKGPAGNGAVRCVYMSAGRLSGFTLTNGHTRTSGSWNYDKSGGGLNARDGGEVTNCIITCNSAEKYGGGTYGGWLNNCTISGNAVADDGGGASDGMINNCTISGNSATNSGGGSLGGTLNNCTISGNSAIFGGGTAYGTINNCKISGNSAVGGGGGTVHSTINNCTISGNSADVIAGGTAYGTINNCIIWNNSAPQSNNFLESTINYSCSSPLPGGVGNISNNPQFVSVSNFHLQKISPCINAGTNALAAMPVDLDGNPRILNRTVDMGCYEYVRPPQIATNALIFPSANSELIEEDLTNIIWHVDKITDDIDSSNLIISKISVHLAETSNEVASVTNDISNLLGKIPWLVPENLVGGDTNYVLKFEVVDSSSLTNSRIFWDNKFTIVPEPTIFLILNFGFALLMFLKR